MIITTFYIIFDPILNYSVQPAAEINSSNKCKVRTFPTFIKFSLEWVLTGNKLKSKPVLFEQHSNVDISVMSKLLEQVLTFDIELKEGFVFLICWCIWLWACTLFDIDSMNNSFTSKKENFSSCKRRIKPVRHCWAASTDFSYYIFKVGRVINSTWLSIPTWRQLPPASLCIHVSNK